MKIGLNDMNQMKIEGNLKLNAQSFFYYSHSFNVCRLALNVTVARIEYVLLLND